MSKRRNLFLGIGCIAVLAGIVIGVIALFAIAKPRLPKEMAIGIQFSGPIVEVTTEDPFAEMMGEQPMSLRGLRKALVKAAEDERVHGVQLRIDGLGGGFGTVQEIRSLLERVRAAGKWTAVYMDTAGEFTPGNGIYWLASACDEISMNPQGDVNLIGLSVRSMFIRGSLDKLGVNPEIPGRGRYKTARFMYTNTDFTPAHREMLEWLVGSLMDQMVGDIATGREMQPDEVRELINRGPFLGDEALNAGLVDRLEDWEEFTSRLKGSYPGADDVVGVGRYADSSESLAVAPKIAVVTALGTIMRGENRTNVNPLFGGDVMGAETIAKAWRNVRRNGSIKAAIFRIDSGGGSAVASEIIRREMARTAQKIPVVVSMGNAAASGGYWIACGAQKIVAYPGSQVGSIGVYAGHLNLERFWTDKLGVSFGRLDFGDNANFYGELADWTPEQRAIADRMLDRIYDDFRERVAEARNSTPEQVHEIGEGRVFTGEQALENGLVDAVGGFDRALVEARRLAGLADDARISLVDYPKLLPWWQQFAKKRREDQVATRAAIEELTRAFQTGVLQTPGAVWMPPLIIE